MSTPEKQSNTEVGEECKEGFRDYGDSVAANVKECYRLGRLYQCVHYVRAMQKKHLKFDLKMSVQSVFEKLATFVDISDPDISLPNYYHGIQTAESIRKDGHPEWLQLTGLIHDLGKIMYLRGCDVDGTSMKTQWGIVGDTFVVGCSLPDTLVFPEFNESNPDSKHEEYNTKHGIYKSGCGLENVLCSWGHDEYLYQVLKHNKCPLPAEALYIIRFHSLYAHHKHNSYAHLTSDADKALLPWLKCFNKYDLYTKTDNFVLTEEIETYYSKLVNKYLNGGILVF